jgi:transposase-like protein
MEIEIPRDREGKFEPVIIPKHQREWRGFDDKIISMLGLTTRQIQEHLKGNCNVTFILMIAVLCLVEKKLQYFEPYLS